MKFGVPSECWLSCGEGVGVGGRCCDAKGGNKENGCFHLVAKHCLGSSGSVFLSLSSN